MKINISLDDELVKRIDSFADDNYMSRSGLISFATNQFLCQNEAIGAVKTLSVAFQKIAETGEIDPETLEQLKDFERLAKLFNS